MNISKIIIQNSMYLKELPVANIRQAVIQNIIRAAAQKAGIKKHTTMHALRHTFATHSLENGVDLRYIQSMMGHESSKTNHITTKGFDQIKSPLDNLEI